MVSEWMDHGCLAAYLKANPDVNRIKPVSDSYRICLGTNYKETKCVEICSGLCYIHENGMVGVSMIELYMQN